MNFPRGFVFQPTDEEIVRCYLYPKVMGFELPWDGILERDVYGDGDGAEPWNVFSDADDWHTEKESCDTTKKSIYAFTKAKATSTWSSHSGPKPVRRSRTGKVIGCKRMLSFRCPEADEDLGHWIMHEYSLSNIKTDLVLCKITKFIKKASKTPATKKFSMAGKRGGQEIEREGCKKQKF